MVKLRSYFQEKLCVAATSHILDDLISELALLLKQRAIVLAFVVALQLVVFAEE